MALAFARLDTRRHDRVSFACGTPALDHYLQKQAGQHQRDGIATTHVLIDTRQPETVLGYCSLSAAQLQLQELSEADRKRLPAWPVPALRMARLAVSLKEQGKGHGQLLVGHAVNLALSVRETLGVRVLIVDAKDTQAAAFYESYGFRKTASTALTLYLPLSM